MAESAEAAAAAAAAGLLSSQEVLKLLCSHLKLDRDRGVGALEKLLKSWESPSDELIR